MFKVGDLVQHKTTGKIGKIVGYGYRLADSIYFMTLKVKPLKGHCFRSPIEDAMNEWRFVRSNSSQSIYPGLRQHRLVA